MWPNIVVLFLIPVIIICHPIATDTELVMKPDMKEENVFPNGTVAGKYSYMDKEGNPVEVKYYADGANYGVELKSQKVVEGDSEKVQYSKQAKLEFSSNPSTVMSVDPDGAEFDMNLPGADTKSKIPTDFFSEKLARKYHSKDEKSGAYDTVLEDVHYPQIKKNRKDKNRVHYGPNRVARNALHFYKKPIMCDQY